MTAIGQALKQDWETQSYVLVRGLITPAEAEALRTICEHVLERWFDHPQEGDAHTADDTSVLMRHVNHPSYFRGHRDWFVTLMEAIADPRILDVVRGVIGPDVMYYCTSLFFNPRGTSRDGNWHRDTQFVTPDEEAERAMLFSPAVADTAGVQLQLALVPTEDTEVVPGSHLRWDTPEEYAIRRADGGARNQSNTMPGALRVHLEPGDAVAFNSYALHRGRYHVDKLRRTLMLTYACPGAYEPNYFTHQPWLLEPGLLDGLRPETRAFFGTLIERGKADWRSGKGFSPG